MQRDFFTHVANSLGATITVTQYNGVLLGGYNDQSWTSSGTFRSSSSAFLFDSGATMNPLTPANAIYDDPNMGPTWGAGYDFQAFGSGNTGSFSQNTYGSWTHGSAPSPFQSTNVWVFYGLGLGNKLTTAQVTAVNSYIHTEFVSLAGATMCFNTEDSGFSASLFHSQCDTKGATLTVAMYNNNGQLFGAFTDQPWTSAQNYKSSSYTFLFDSTRVIYPTTTGNQANAMYDNSGYGPTFGAGHDWNSFGVSTASTGYFSVSSYAAWTHGGSATSSTLSNVWVYYGLFFNTPMTNAQRLIVNNYIGVERLSISQSSKECYETSFYGFSASYFHSRCDGKGATLTVVEYNGALFGGYNDQSWTSSNGYRASLTPSCSTVGS